ncbi:MAG: hypothetical protein IJ092_10275, partial [Atopobiaceae bacterium]|nr:hypothetical protein [Atopobiaceae bacterium]
MRFVHQPVGKVLSLALSASLVFQSFPISALARMSYDTQGEALAPASSTWIADQLAALAEEQAAQEAAQTKVDESNETIESLKEQIASHEDTIAEAQGSVSQRQEELEQAQAQADGAADQLETAKKAYDENEEAIADAQKRIEELEKIADGDLSEWEKAVTDAEDALANAQSDLDDAQAELDELEEQKASGSFGFFEYYGATSALNALNNSTYADKTQKGDADDATSLESMRESLTWMRKLNEIRSGLGLGELAVTDYLMACAQADANYSDTVVAHAEQFDVAENVAWNYGSNPFDQWYNEEKAYFDEAWASATEGVASSAPTGAEAVSWYSNNSDAVEKYLIEHYPNPDDPSLSEVSVGHYLNCIDPDFTVTGFAICTRGTMDGWFTYDQTFANSGSPSFTLDEYENRIDAYVEAMEEAIPSAEKKVTDAEAALSEAEEALAQAQQALK